mgnify:CR=1 FL=1
MADKFAYVLNAGFDSAPAIAATYANRGTLFPASAFANGSVNPTIKTTGITEENATTSSTVSVNCFEIRTAPFDGRLTGDADTQILNRVYPSSSTVTSYGINKQTTPNFLLRIYDEMQTTTGSKIILNGSAASDEVLLDMDTYDYFVLINPEITYAADSGVTLTSIRPHFAKIKSLSKYDEFGDGFEITPRYKGELTEGTKFEIYKGPAKTDTDVVAVGYGLRGDSATSGGTNFLTDKYDVLNTVSKPTFYFYNDRLENKDHLDYDTKYQLVSARWWKDWTSVESKTLVENPNAGIYEGTATLDWSAAPTMTIPIGSTLWVDDGGSKYIVGNISVKTDADTYTIDNLRRNVNSALTAYVGRSYCYPCFKTEQEFGNRIGDISPYSMDADLIDTVRTHDDTSTPVEDLRASHTYTFVPESWKDAFRNMYRSTKDKNSAESTNGTTNGYLNTAFGKDKFDETGTVAFIHADLTGPKRYIEYQLSQDKTNIMPQVIESHINSPMSTISKMATVKAIDQKGLLSSKIKKFDVLKINEILYNGEVKYLSLPGKVNTSGSDLVFSELKDEEDLSNLLVAGSVILIDKYYYKVGAIATKSTNTIQNVTVAAHREKDSTAFTTSTTPQTHKDKKAKVYAWVNSKLKVEFNIDSKVNHSQNNRLSISNATITASQSEVSKSKLVFNNGQFVGNIIDLNYGDNVHKYIIPSDITKNLYIPNGSQYFKYYNGGYVIEREVFNGEVEDIDSKQEEGLITYTVSGRNQTSQLLGGTVNKNLSLGKDIVYSSFAPIQTPSIAYNVYHPSGTGKVINTVGVGDLREQLPIGTLIFTSSGLKLIGEVELITFTTTPFDINFITLKEELYETISTLSGSPTAIKGISTIGKNWLVGNKSLDTNLTGENTPTTLKGASNKGVVFSAGQKTILTQSTLSTSDLIGTSATGSLATDGSLGYHLHSIKSIDRDKDPPIAFKLGEEKPISTTQSNIHVPSSMSKFTVISSESYEGFNGVFEVAPIFPVVLGTVNSNSSDSRITGNSNLYLSNTQGLPIGGFIHELFSSYEIYPRGVNNKLIKYSDLSKFNEGNLDLTLTNEQYKNTASQAIRGYAQGYSINADGTIATDFTTEQSLLPIQGSNFWDYTEISGMTTPPIYIKEYLIGTDYATKHTQDIKSHWEILDPKCTNNKLLALGDLYPDSMLRQNHLGFKDASNNTYDFTKMGLIIQTEPTYSQNIEHENYDGQSKQSSITDGNYERLSIQKASITPNQMRRFGALRLVEATFDWHFNPVDGETMTSAVSDADANKITMTKDATNGYNNYFRSVLPVIAGTVTSHSGTSTTIALSSVSGLSTSSPDITILYKSDGTLVGKIASIASLNVTVATLHSGNLPASTQLYYIKSTKADYHPLETFGIYGQDTPGNLLDDNINRTKDIYFTMGYAINDMIDKSYMEFASSIFQDYDNSGVGAGENYFYWLGNVVHPLIFMPRTVENAYSASYVNNWAKQAMLPEKMWINSSSSDVSTAQHYYHPSRVLSWLQDKQMHNYLLQPTGGLHDTISSHLTTAGFDIATAATKAAFYYGGTGNPYRNCEIVVTESKRVFNETTDTVGSSTYIVDNPYTYFLTKYEQNQMSDNVFTTLEGDDKSLLLLNTKQRFKHFSGIGRELSASYGSNGASDEEHPANDAHNVSAGCVVNTGHSRAIQYLFKPQFNFADTTTVTGHPNKDALLDISSTVSKATGTVWKFKIGTTGTHNWLTFAPNLTGYFLVSCKNHANTLELPHIWNEGPHMGIHAFPVETDSSTTLVAEIGSGLDYKFNDADWLVTAYDPTNGNHHEIEVTDATDLSAGNVLYKYGTYERVGIVDSVSGTTITLRAAGNRTGEVQSEILLIPGDKLIVGVARTTTKFTNSVQPSIISQIISHEVTFESNELYHTITVDKPIPAPTDTSGVFSACNYKLMRISQQFSPQKAFNGGIEFYKMLNGPGMFANWRGFENKDRLYRGDSWNTKQTLGGICTPQQGGASGIYYMYVLADIDTGSTSSTNYVIRRNVTDFVRPNGTNLIYSNNQQLDVNITDGNSSIRKTISIIYNRTNNTLRFAGFEGNEKNFKGIVSVGEVFNITTDKAPQTTNAKLANIGSTYSIATEAEAAIEEILEENDISFNRTNTLFTYSGLLVNATPTISGGKTLIVTTETIINEVAIGDTIYNMENELVGEIESITGTPLRTITLTKEAFADLAQYDEILTYTTKPLFISANFKELDIFSALNYCATQKSLSLQANKTGVILSDLNNKRGFEKKSIGYNNHQQYVQEVNANTSLFDYANKVTVVGDGVVSSVEKPEERNTKTLKIIDPNITTISEARIKAEQLLDIHTSEEKKIVIKVHKNGLENVKAGDIITAHFPRQGVEKNDYVVFEIKDELADTKEISLGRYTKSIADRLAEISASTSKLGTAFFTKNAIDDTVSKRAYQTFTVKPVQLLMTRFNINNQPTLGFELILGFTNTIGWGETVTTVTEIEI